nr:MAG TPA: hypothetical protein [Caudoviricetes sp.]
MEISLRYQGTLSRPVKNAIRISYSVLNYVCFPVAVNLLLSL